MPFKERFETERIHCLIILNTEENDNSSLVFEVPLDTCTVGGENVIWLPGNTFDPLCFEEIEVKGCTWPAFANIYLGAVFYRTGNTNDQSRVNSSLPVPLTLIF